MIQHFHVVVVPAGVVIFYVYLEFNHHRGLALFKLTTSDDNLLRIGIMFSK